VLPIISASQPAKLLLLQLVTALFDFFKKEETSRNPLFRFKRLCGHYRLLKGSFCLLPITEVSGNEKQ
jgi:hypothetical protein